MVKIAMQNDIGIEEVKNTFYRYVLAEKFGFKCDHPEEKVKTNKEKGKTYCSWCWTRLDVIREHRMERNINKYTLIPGKYKAKKSFLDELKGGRPEDTMEQMHISE